MAIIEKGPLGGTCLNRGCIPSKMLIHSADVVETIKMAHLFGIKVKGYEIDFSSIVKRVSDNVDHEATEIERNLRQVRNPLLFKENSNFIGHKTLRVGKETIRAERILIASGGRPALPNLEGLQGSGFITSDEALRLRTQPKVLTIIGGGYVAAELAHFFGSLGTQVNIVHKYPTLLNKEDQEISTKYTEIAHRKFSVFTGFEPAKVSRTESEFEVTIKSANRNETKKLMSDQLLVAIGRIPNSDLLEVDKTGVKTDKRGYIITDEYLQTNVKGIFALGDAAGHCLFKHSANLEAEYAYYNLLSDNKIPVDYTAMPHAIFTSPQIAAVGKTERELVAEGKKYLVGKYRLIDTGMGIAIEDREGFVKILVEQDTGKILGCHIMGTEASTLIHEVIVAMKSGEGTFRNITGSVHIHPALNEVVQRAAFNLQ